MVDLIERSKKRKPLKDRKIEKEGVPLKKSDEKDAGPTSVDKTELVPRLGINF